MPDDNKDIQVTYDPTAVPEWVIDPIKVPIGKGKLGVIRWHRNPANAPWTFVRINEVPANWTQRVKHHGAELEVKDPNKFANSYIYTITIAYAGVEHTSPFAKILEVDPPIIMNEGS